MIGSWVYTLPVLRRWTKFDTDNGVYIFHHMPKCGGTALREGLEKWFRLKHDYISVAQLCGEEPVARVLDLRTMEKSACVCGHFECQYNHLHVRYPEVLRNRRRYFLFSFVREPLDLAKSLYYHAIRAGRLDMRSHTLTDFIDQQCNYMAQRFPCTISNYRHVLDRYQFIGLQEDMSRSIKTMAYMLGREPFQVPLRNTSPRDHQETELSEETVARFTSRNALDYTIYHYVQKRLFR